MLSSDEHDIPRREHGCAAAANACAARENPGAWRRSSCSPDGNPGSPAETSCSPAAKVGSAPAHAGSAREIPCAARANSGSPGKVGPVRPARDNPFNVQRVLEIRYRLPMGVTWEDLLDRLAALRWRAAIVGPHGHGKTTLLEDLAPRLEARGFRVRTISLREAHPRLDQADRAVLRSFGPRDVLLLDGAEQLGWLSWRLLRLCTWKDGGLVITSHRSGLLPTLFECETTPELLAGIVGELSGTEVDAEEVLARHGGNVRDALRELYDRWAGR